MQGFLDILLPLTISIIMLGIGMSLSLADFKRVFESPKAISYGLFGQLFLLPIVALTIAFIFPLSPVHQLGILLIAICPGGTSSNIVTYLLKGEIALSVSITAFNSFIIVLTIPLLLKLVFYLFDIPAENIELSLFHTFIEVLYTVLLPVIIGILLRHFFPQSTEKLQKPMRYILPGLLFLVFSLVLLVETQDKGVSAAHYGSLLIPALLLNVLVIGLGFYFSKWLKLTSKEQYTIAIEMGLQNSALAIYLANNVLQIEQLSLIAVLYGSFSFFSTFILGFLLKKYGNGVRN